MYKLRQLAPVFTTCPREDEIALVSNFFMKIILYYFPLAIAFFKNRFYSHRYHRVSNCFFALQPKGPKVLVCNSNSNLIFHNVLFIDAQNFGIRSINESGVVTKVKMAAKVLRCYLAPGQHSSVLHTRALSLGSGCLDLEILKGKTLR